MIPVTCWLQRLYLLKACVLTYVNLNLQMAAFFHNIDCNYIDMIGTVEKLLHVCFHIITKYNNYVCIINTTFFPLTLLTVFRYLLFEYQAILRYKTKVFRNVTL